MNSSFKSGLWNSTSGVFQHSIHVSTVIFWWWSSWCWSLWAMIVFVRSGKQEGKSGHASESCRYGRGPWEDNLFLLLSKDYSFKWLRIQPPLMWHLFFGKCRQRKWVFSTFVILFFKLNRLIAVIFLAFSMIYLWVQKQ